MRKMISLAGLMLILVLPLTGFALPTVSHGASQSKQFDWYGGPKYIHEVMEGKTVAEISEIASHQATFYDLPVMYKAEEGKMVIRAYPDYGKSKDCASVHEEAWKEAKLITDKVAKVCVPSYGTEKYDGR